MALRTGFEERRRFLKCSACALGAAFLTGCRDSGSSTGAVPIPIPLGLAREFRWGATVRPVERLAIVRDGAGFGALSLRCTHQECLVTYTSTEAPIECPCHGARFSSDGVVLSGPAPTDLPWYEVTVNEAGVLSVLVGSTVPRGWRYPWNGAQLP
jgi:nitrite reductase/ring-hydroxylating ferredoxin subunit